MIRKGVYSIPVSGKVSISNIRNNSRQMYERTSNGDYQAAGDYVKVSDIPDYVDYTDEAEVELLIDDAPFNRGVSKCSTKVKNLHDEVDSLTSGVNIGSATISGAKHSAALTIGNSLERGFSRYIHSMIRESKILVQAKLPALQATIEASSKQLADRRTALENDYKRITARYSKIMAQLQELLDSRVHELDRPAFEICSIINQDVFVDPLGVAFGQSVCSGTEQLTTADSVKIATVKDNAMLTMTKIQDHILSLRRLKMAINNILSEHAVSGQTRLSIPVLRLAGDSLEADSENVQTFYPEGFADKKTDPAQEKILQKFEDLPSTSKSHRECEEIDQCFQRHISSWMVDHKDTDPRVLEFIREMWKNSKTKLSN